MHYRFGVLALLACTIAFSSEQRMARATDEKPEALSAASALDPAKVEFFEKHVRPVLIEHCYSCHAAGAASVEGELLLDTQAGLLRGGASGKAVVPGEPQASLLLKAVKYDGLEMPPDRRLKPEVVERLEQWIRDGAVDPRMSEQSSPTAKTEPIDWQQARRFWSFQNPRRADLSDVSRPEWLLNRIDAIVLARMESKLLSPAETADGHTLLRRVTLDLTDLPPTFEQSVEFAADARPDAYERTVDRLLGSAAFGERWARPWLDLARYGEDQAHIVGNDRSLCYPNAYMYRDWVIESLNADLPYDEFVREQLAADLIDHHTAFYDVRPLGFLGLGPKYYNRGSPEVMADEWEDRVDVVTRGLLGLTAACARCHDHKYDPIPTQDYYALAGIFAATSMFNRPMESDVETKDNGDAKNPDHAVHVVRDGKPTDLQVMIRGDVKRKGATAPRGFLQVLRRTDAGEWQVKETSGRLQLADAVASIDNPLFARVFVNRVWAALIGRPLVSTPSNFGKLGSEPTHPELLDDLSVRFMQSGWSIKWLVREIVLSRTYRQSSRGSSEQVDPENIYVSRMNRKRLTVEGWRDSVLFTAGRLDRRIAGASMNPQDPSSVRRTLYSEVSRLELNKMLSLFDFPDANVHAEQRARTTTALQKLFVLNSLFMLEQARSLEHSIASETCSDLRNSDLPNDYDPQASRVTELWRRVFARNPTADEQNAVIGYVNERFATLPDGSVEEDRSAVWQEVAHTLLSANELMFCD
ncbi:MAG: PSD1 and planctomycete cytochrome C domain-containing protein [Pirellulales bacterium]